MPSSFYYCLLLFGVFISSISQVLLKKESQRKHDSLIKEYLNFPVIFAYFLFFVSTILSILAYKAVPLSHGPVLEATSYIYVMIYGVVIFKEKLNWKRIVSILIIIFGIVVFTL